MLGKSLVTVCLYDVMCGALILIAAHHYYILHVWCSGSFCLSYFVRGFLLVLSINEFAPVLYNEGLNPYSSAALFAGFSRWGCNRHHHSCHEKGERRK